MTLFGFDVSSYNPSYRPAAGTFHIVKASEGAHTHDPSWAALSARVRAAKGTLLVAYHFLHSDSTPAAQAANTAAVPGIKGVPLMVDVEVEGSSRPTIGQCAAYVDEARALGLDPRLVYLPKWYWQELGSPSLQPLVSRGLHLVSSAYPNQGHYPGDGGSGWEPYGGMTPLIWQYSSVPLDCDAYKGTLAQLAAVLGGTTPEEDMALTDADVQKIWDHTETNRASGKPVRMGTVLAWEDFERQQTVSSLTAQLGAVSGALVALSKAVAAGGGLTAAQVTAAAQAGAAAALAELGKDLVGQ